MLSQKYRLPSSIKLAHPRYARSAWFSFKYAANGLPVSRFAFVVKKTTDKRAVRRNRIRRVFRSCIEEVIGEIIPGFDMLFFLEKGIMEVTRDTLLGEIKIVLEKNSLVKKV
jgi:ribonuclease P protein component